MARQVKSIALAYLFHSHTGNSIYYHAPRRTHRCQSAVGLRKTGEQDCGGLRKKFSRGERAVENNPRLYCITKLAQIQPISPCPSLKPVKRP